MSKRIRAAADEAEYIDAAVAEDRRPSFPTDSARAIAAANAAAGFPPPAQHAELLDAPAEIPEAAPATDQTKEG